MSHILLIDDDELFRRMLRATLQSLGHTVQEAVDGREGLALAAGARADLMILDLVMPEKEGLEVLLELRKRPLGRPIKIIAMTGGGRGRNAGGYLRMARMLGADRVLAKPFGREELGRALTELLGPGPAGAPSAASGDI